jgi:CheY-like chemotaxis protein
VAAAKEKVVLVVDDHDDCREATRELLAVEGYEVATASNGVEALATLRNVDFRPCVLVLDLAMPGMDGRAVYAEVRRDPRLSEIPVIFATANPDLAPPGSHVVSKPIAVDRLVAIVKSACGPASG